MVEIQPKRKQISYVLEEFIFSRCEFSISMQRTELVRHTFFVAGTNGSKHTVTNLHVSTFQLPVGNKIALEIVKIVVVMFKHFFRCKRCNRHRFSTIYFCVTQKCNNLIHGIDKMVDLVVIPFEFLPVQSLKGIGNLCCEYITWRQHEKHIATVRQKLPLTEILLCSFLQVVSGRKVFCIKFR